MSLMLTSLFIGMPPLTRSASAISDKRNVTVGLQKLNMHSSYRKYVSQIPKSRSGEMKLNFAIRHGNVSQDLRILSD